MLGTFTGRKLGDFATFKDMRRVINGTDRADMIAGYASKFLAALQASEMGVTLPPPPDVDHHPGPQPQPDAKARQRLLLWLWGVLAVLAAGAIWLLSTQVHIF
jgi:hypothetical protein